MMQNLLHLLRKTRFARLSPPADSRAFGARGLFLNRVFDKDYLSPCSPGLTSLDNNTLVVGCAIKLRHVRSAPAKEGKNTV